jgi:S-adenosylmethionine synthetase
MPMQDEKQQTMIQALRDYARDKLRQLDVDSDTFLI